MSENSIFAYEERAIEEAERLLASNAFRDHPLAGSYAELLGKYKKLYSQTCRMVRMSDRMQKELSLLTERLERLSNVDGLTGVANRRCLDEVLEKEWLRACRRGESLSVLMIDIDFFKKYNDLYGHLEGDSCLGRVARAIRASLKRPDDFIARFGGEEFVVILPKADLRGALQVAERILAAVLGLGIRHEYAAANGQITVSIGVSSTVPSPNRSHNQLLVASDAALYEAKRQGRNRVCVREWPEIA